MWLMLVQDTNGVPEIDVSTQLHGANWVAETQALTFQGNQFSAGMYIVLLILVSLVN